MQPPPLPSPPPMPPCPGRKSRVELRLLGTAALSVEVLRSADLAPKDAW